MIRKLILQNWKSHKNSEFAFADGTNVLVGIMGSGKSSVVDAISFALFGTYPALSQRKVKLEDVVLRGETTAHVELVFELDAQEYTVRRTIEKGRTATSEFLQGSTVIESPQSSKVTEAVENTIKMDYDLFTRAIYAEQNAIDYFLTIPRGQRMKRMDALLKLDKFETARANANTLINRIKDEKKTKMALLDRLEMSDAIKSYDKVKREVSISTEKIGELEKHAELLVKDVNATRKEIELLEEQEKQKVEIDRKMITVKTSIDELEKRAKDISSHLDGSLLLTDPKDLMDQHQKLQEKLLQKESELKQRENELSTAKARLEMQKSIYSDLSKRIQELESVKKEMHGIIDLEKLKSILEEKSKDLDNQKRILFSSRSEIEHQKDHLQKLNKDGCPVCEREMNEDLYNKIKTVKEIKISDLEKTSEDSRMRVASLEKELEELNSKRVKLEVLQQRQRNLEEDRKKEGDIRKALEDLGTKIPSIENSIRALSTEREKLNAELRSLEVRIIESKSLEEKRTELKNIRARLEELYREKKAIELSDVKFDHDVLKMIRSRFERLLSQRATVDSQINAEKRLLQERRERLEGIESQKATLETLKSEIISLEGYQKQIKVLSESLERVQSRLRQEFIKTVNMVMSEIWREFYPYQDYTDIRLSIEEGDYVLELKTGTWIGVEGVASGGERSSAALVLRIALALVLAPNLRWLILDEPTHNLDANAIEQLSTILRHKITEFVDQVFLITHEPRLEDAVSGYLYRLDRPESKKTPTSVQQIDIMKED